ncbi:hypothetical protein PGT21_033882 [Puccinia graminis f. sp. tritici]|uniref:Uncharacterized protein n=1 Tax=Puccinia graminis f. sp. tritici TaxID=56615 RepID=A0A5B0MQG2_PUCGR|nr:hypothetical protein PGT21_033882 [Puccinia graminis f. sp. tritici]
MPIRVRYSPHQLEWVTQAYNRVAIFLSRIEDDISQTAKKDEYYEQMQQNHVILEVEVLQHELNNEAARLSVCKSGIPNVKCLWDAKRASLGRGPVEMYLTRSSSPKPENPYLPTGCMDGTIQWPLREEVNSFSTTALIPINGH